jgi:hypothetical protein
MWAYERAGAPRAYRIAAIKAVSSSGRSLQRIQQLFRTFYSAKLNDSGNPARDDRMSMIDVP